MLADWWWFPRWGTGDHLTGIDAGSVIAWLPLQAVDDKDLDGLLLQLHTDSELFPDRFDQRDGAGRLACRIAANSNGCRRAEVQGRIPLAVQTGRIEHRPANVAGCMPLIVMLRQVSGHDELDRATAGPESSDADRKPNFGR